MHSTSSSVGLLAYIIGLKSHVDNLMSIHKQQFRRKLAASKMPKFLSLSKASAWMALQSPLAYVTWSMVSKVDKMVFSDCQLIEANHYIQKSSLTFFETTIILSSTSAS